MPPPRPMLRLSVREITSVSATFILSSRLDSSIDPSLSTLGIDRSDEKAANAASEHGVTSESVIADTLSKGLSVTVNGSAWPRTFIRIDDQADEAVIIIYALLPRRQYDIELGLAACHAEHPHQQDPAMGDVTCSLTRQIITQEHETKNDPDSAIIENGSTLSSSSSSSPLSTPSSSAHPTNVPFISPPLTQPPPPLQPTLADRLSQLHQTLTHLTTERDTLLTSLKSSRRESQKADASLRAEIDTLKRTFDKNASFELRTRQKLLALQESVKRAQNAALESEGMTRDVAVEILELARRKEEKEEEHRMAEDGAATVRREREEVEEKERKRVEGMRAELNGLTNKLERLNGKREKMEAVVIPDLESKIGDIESEIEDAEREVVNLDKAEQIRLQFEETFHCNYHYQLPDSPPSLWSRTHNTKSQSMHATYPELPHRSSSLKTTSKSLSIMDTASSTRTLFLNDHPSPSNTSSSTRSSPGTSGSIKAGYSPGALGYSPTPPSGHMSPSMSDPLAVGAGRPSRRSFEATVWKSAE